MTWLDITTASSFDLFETCFPGILGKFPKCKKILDKVSNLSTLKDYLASRPPLEGFEAPY